MCTTNNNNTAPMVALKPMDTRKNHASLRLEKSKCTKAVSWRVIFTLAIIFLVRHYLTSPLFSDIDDGVRKIKPELGKTVDVGSLINQLVRARVEGSKHVVSPAAPYKVLLTNYGWNHPDLGEALQFGRLLRSKELIEGILKHPNFDALEWEALIKGDRKPDPTLRYYVFLDVETCYETNYPVYGKGRLENLERYSTQLHVDDCRSTRHCPALRKAFAEQKLKAALLSGQMTIIYLDCNIRTASANIRNHLKTMYPSLSMASISADVTDRLALWDQGLPPPAGKKVTLSALEVEAVQSCDTSRRQYLLSFIGDLSRHPVRRELVKLHNPPSVILSARSQFFSPKTPYEQMLSESRYGAVPRGDVQFSYRLTEVLSAGAIPVVYSDGWMLPFMPEVANWSQCALVIPEGNVSMTVTYLKRISVAEECSRRQHCYRIYSAFMENTTGVIDGLVKSLEATKGKRGRPQPAAKQKMIASIP